jgi:prepilin-type N-terminal cleavage/methylation domain-containing protein
MDGAPAPLATGSPMMYTNEPNASQAQHADRGFTLIEILIAIVLVGILSSVAIVGISNLVSKGAKSACGASADAAKAASHVYFATNAAYPSNFTQLTTAGVGGAPLVLASGATINSTASVAPAVPTGVAAGLQVSNGTTWFMTMTGGTVTTPPSFSCSP